MTTPIIAFIGLGEAGTHIARGLLGAGIEEIRAYDILIDDPERRDAWIAKAEGIGVVPCATAEEAAVGASIVFSTVTSGEAPVAAASVAPHMGQGQIFLDLNSCAPSKKEKGFAILDRPDGATYIDVAVMDNVPGKGHAVPMLLSGPRMADVVERLTPHGMNMKVVGDRIGEASAIKMCRSVFMKGFEAVLCESMVAARRAGVEDRVLASIQATFPQIDWSQHAPRQLGRMAIHGGRRAQEMDSVADTLRDLGVEPMTAESTGRREAWIAGLGLRDQFMEQAPESLENFLDAVSKAENR